MTGDRLFVALDVKPGAALESQSGLQANWPRVYGVLSGAVSGNVGAIIIHPTSNFMGHYLLDPLAERGVGLLALNTRYNGNDSTLLMERAIQDLGAGVAFMRKRYKTVVLLGNSGGAALTAFYQGQAEQPSITQTPAGDPFVIAPGELPPADGIALLAGHLGRSHLMSNWIDPSVLSEQDGRGADPELDLYNPDNGPPFSSAFLERYRAEQRRRSEAITDYVIRRLRYVRALNGPGADEALLVHRTYADPRFIDLTIDPNDRRPGGNRGDNAQSVNYGANNLGRFSTLTSWLSQWSSRSAADGPAGLARTTVPVLQLEYTADGSVFPADIAAWSAACGGRDEHHRIVGGNHYLKDQPELVSEVADLISAWSKSLN